MSFKGLLAGYHKKDTAPPSTIKKDIYSPLWQKIVQYKENDRFVALLFIIIDEFPNELLWRVWLEENTSEKYKIRVWFHAKFPSKVKSSWVKERLVQSFHLNPEWGSLELTKVMLAMLYEAQQDEPNIQKFIFASESCIPIVSLSSAMQSIYATGPNTSWLHPTNMPNNGYAKQLQFDVIGERIPMQYVWKSSQWLLISSYHAQQLIQLCEYLQQPANTANDTNATGLKRTNIQQLIIKNQLFSLFTNTRASDEMFFPTCLSMLDYITKKDDNDNDNNSGRDGVDSAVSSTSTAIVKKYVTYSDWSANGRSPKTFTPFTAEDIVPARQEGSIFFRKIQFLLFTTAFGKEHGLTKENLEKERMTILEKWWKSVYQQDMSKDAAVTWEECVAMAQEYFTAQSLQEAVEEEQMNRRQPVRYDSRDRDRARNDRWNNRGQAQHHQDRNKRSRSRSRDSRDRGRDSNRYNPTTIDSRRNAY